VVGYEQIETPIAVIVEKTAARAPAAPIACDASLFGGIRKRAVVVVVEQKTDRAIKGGAA